MSLSLKAKALGDQPAFPQPFIDQPDRGQYGQQLSACEIGFGGLTKREEFARSAMQGILSNSSGVVNKEELAKSSVLSAEALLEALAKES